MAVATGLKLFDVEERWIDPSIEARVGWSQDPAILKANDARAAGAFAIARNSASAALAKDPGSVDAWRSLLDTELVSGRRSEAAAAATRLLERYVATGESGLAVALAEEVGESLADVLSARFFLAAASARERVGDTDGAWRELEALVARSPKDPASVRAALKMAGFARRAGMVPEALDLLEWGRSHPACEPGFRESALRAGEEILRTSREPPGACRSLPVRRFAAWGEPRTFPAH
jgi:thioredoxin-like negative regulator of GroEL